MAILSIFFLDEEHPMHLRRLAHERGANLVEAALVIPVLILFLGCIVDLGRMYFAQITIIDAAREGALYGAKHYEDATRLADICGVVRDEAAGQLVLTDENINIVSSWAQGTPVKVTVRIANFPLLLGGIIGLPNPNLGHTAAFRIRCTIESGC